MTSEDSVVSPPSGEERKAHYVPDRNGRVRTQAEARQAVERVATEQAVAELERLAAEALADARAGRCSALAYHMYRRRMDPLTLAQASGIWRLRVRRHLRSPRAFQRLPWRIARRYCQALGLSWRELSRLPPGVDGAP
ncbi:MULTISPECIES: hypothetical protein [unclassified Halorhodospira]|uniref:hypothetical protein n=1 Tax=unclassified Halorhodospira TaxID=2626748 RepID=UPI001EE79FD9|nr:MULTISPECIES: hypothetical protein [unclassified Halorhodospira]MCG5540223.1 hypothetical protein [Halorhodospira sp. M39old]MCG5545076.1 hypothetical protein [Halorhodospira sp. M38]